MTKVNFKGNEPKKYAGFELNLSEAELDKRTSKEYSSTFKMLNADAMEYQNLAEGDKQALKHLVKAANILNDVFLKQDNENNIEIRDALVKNAASGDEVAKKALKLFNSQLGISALDRESNMINIFKETKNPDGQNFFPSDMSAEEFQSKLIKMLKEGKAQEVQQILSNRSVVERNGDELIGVDYTEAYRENFVKAANELMLASTLSTNEQFNDFLKKQACALAVNDLEHDCEADTAWALMQDTPLEFTISREQYSDQLTGTVFENEELKELLEKNNINVETKDSIGVRVGIINKEGTEKLLDFKKYLPELAGLMPFKDEYQQTISADEEAKQTMVDADIVYLAGDEGSYRGGITIAQNLPNDDKLSIKRGAGRRNVYHRQIRLGGDPEKRQKRLDAILDKELHKFYQIEADHDFTIGHENAHSLGPSESKAGLGKIANVIEENKADMGSLAFLDYLQEKGKYSEKEKNEILVTWAANNMLKSKPKLSQAHRVRSVMQTNYFIEKGAMNIDEKGVLHLNLEKMVPTAYEMLEDVVKIQIANNGKKAKAFIDKYFAWGDNIEKCAENIRVVDKALHGIVEQPLAEKLIAE